MRNINRAGFGLAVGGLLVCIGGPMHPRGSMDSLDAHMITMLESPVWVVSHVIAMVGTALIAVSLIVLSRSLEPRTLRPFVAVTAVGACLAAVEYPPPHPGGHRTGSAACR
ncbi:hypothetical protein VZC37_19780 [Gordonia sp. LSe1-13]|uniref:DUF998 domain-containing protein n=1 Tax=Gordonia sesuvii TaxID=3116777 RepID=A0ABU7MJ27_9ACTN|nr:hypothetical protein [Gordonia sp. LSe1-13]